MQPSKLYWYSQLYQRYFLKVLAVMVTAKAKARANGKMIQDGCKLNGSARYSTH